MMTPIEFKNLWKPDKFSRWSELDIKELNRAPLTKSTKDFLSIGFPEDAAPFLSFGWSIYKGRFSTISECYPDYGNNNITKNYWIIGSDSAGNPICFDVLQNDKIVLLDHEQGFEVMDVVNKNIVELAQCLLLYKEFVSQVQRDNGEDAFLENNFSKSQIDGLINGFQQIDEDILKNSSFWRNELNMLLDGIG